MTKPEITPEFDLERPLEAAEPFDLNKPIQPDTGVFDLNRPIETALRPALVTVNATPPQEPAARVRTHSRREVLQWFGLAAAGAAVGAAALLKEIKNTEAPPSLKSHESSTETETAETWKPDTSLKFILMNVGANRYLDFYAPHSIFGHDFHFDGITNKYDYNGKETVSFLFNTVGEMSGQLLPTRFDQDYGKTLDQSITAADILHSLTRLMSRDAPETAIVEYIAWLYKISLGIELNPAKISLEKHDDGIFFKIVAVRYNGQVPPVKTTVAKLKYQYKDSDPSAEHMSHDMTEDNTDVYEKNFQIVKNGELVWPPSIAPSSGVRGMIVVPEHLLSDVQMVSVPMTFPSATPAEIKAADDALVAKLLSGQLNIEGGMGIKKKMREMYPHLFVGYTAYANMYLDRLAEDLRRYGKLWEQEPKLAIDVSNNPLFKGLPEEVLKKIQSNFVDISKWVDGDDPTVKDVAEAITRDAKTDEEKAQICLKYAQQFDYIWDKSTSGMEKARFPSATILCRGGDCEDGVILFCSLLLALGIHPKIFYIVVPQGFHVMAGVPGRAERFKIGSENPKKWNGFFPAELTAYGPQIGYANEMLSEQNIMHEIQL